MAPHPALHVLAPSSNIAPLTKHVIIYSAGATCALPHAASAALPHPLLTPHLANIPNTHSLCAQVLHVLAARRLLPRYHLTRSLQQLLGVDEWHASAAPPLQAAQSVPLSAVQPAAPQPVRRPMASPFASSDAAAAAAVAAAAGGCAAMHADAAGAGAAATAEQRGPLLDAMTEDVPGGLPFLSALGAFSSRYAYSAQGGITCMEPHPTLAPAQAGTLLHGSVPAPVRPTCAWHWLLSDSPHQLSPISYHYQTQVVTSW